MTVLILSTILQILAMVAHITNTQPALADKLAQFLPVLMSQLLDIFGKVAGLTPEERAKVLADHNALVEKYKDPPA